MTEIATWSRVEIGKLRYALRTKAKLCRRAAAHKTNGGSVEDNILLLIAEHFEWELDRLNDSLKEEK